LFGREWSHWQSDVQTVVLLLALVAVVSAKVYFQEKFDDGEVTCPVRT